MTTIEIFVLLIIAIFALTAKRERIIYFFIFFLPLNTFVKDVLTLYGGGNYFSMWKELIILLLFLRSLKEVNWNNFKILSLFLVFVIVSFLLTKDKGDGIPSFRDHFFTGILFITIASIPLQTKVLFNCAKTLFYVLIVFNIIGLLQVTIPAVRDTIDVVMSRIDTVDGYGNIIYNASSYYIMGIYRMSSIMEGPNVFGVTNAFVLLLHLFLLMRITRNNVLYKQTHSVIFKISLILSIVCLIASFSRAGFAIFIVGYILLLIFQGYKVYKTIITICVTLIPIILIALYISDDFNTIISGTLSGNEASSADRTNNLMRGLSGNTISLFGNGLGTCKIGSKHFTESSFVNFIFELGIIPFVFLLLFFLIVYFCSKKNIINNDFAILSSALIPPVLLACLFTINCYANPFLFIWWMFMAIGIKKCKYKLNY